MLDYCRTTERQRQRGRL